MVESLGEDDGVRNSDVSVQHSQGGRVQSSAGQQAGYQVDIARSIPVWWDIQCQMGYDLVQYLDWQSLQTGSLGHSRGRTAQFQCFIFIFMLLLLLLLLLLRLWWRWIGGFFFPCPSSSLSSSK